MKCLNYFLQCCDKISDASNLKKKVFILTHKSKAQSLQKNQGTKAWNSGCITSSQEEESVVQTTMFAETHWEELGDVAELEEVYHLK